MDWDGIEQKVSIYIIALLRECVLGKIYY